MCQLDRSKAMGGDGLPTVILKYCADVLTSSITKLFNLSITAGKLPDNCKKANIVPIH